MVPLFTLLLAVTISAQSVPDGAMTREERDYLVEYMKTTQTVLVQAMKGVSEAQWKFKPDEQTWSIANVMEHLILTEAYFLNDLTKKILATPAQSRLATAIASEDRKFAAAIADRSKKGKAPEMLVPTNQWPDKASALQEFRARRGRTIEYVSTTKDALRAHHGGGNNPRDVYQYLVLVAAHTARHTAQIEEVKTHASFPK